MRSASSWTVSDCAARRESKPQASLAMEMLSAMKSSCGHNARFLTASLAGSSSLAAYCLDEEGLDAAGHAGARVLGGAGGVGGGVAAARLAVSGGAACAPTPSGVQRPPPPARFSPKPKQGVGEEGPLGAQ